MKLRIVGNDVNAERQKLEQQCRALGLEDRVQWCGYLEGEALRAEYSRATGLEAVFGYLWMSGNEERVRELFAEILRNT